MILGLRKKLERKTVLRSKRRLITYYKVSFITHLFFYFGEIAVKKVGISKYIFDYLKIAH